MRQSSSVCASQNALDDVNKRWPPSCVCMCTAAGATNGVARFFPTSILPRHVSLLVRTQADSRRKEADTGPALAGVTAVCPAGQVTVTRVVEPDDLQRVCVWCGRERAPSSSRRRRRHLRLFLLRAVDFSGAVSSAAVRAYYGLGGPETASAIASRRLAFR